MSKLNRAKGPTLRELSKLLNISVGSAYNLRKRGMPADIEEAKKWCALRKEKRGSLTVFTAAGIDLANTDIENETLEDTIKRLRRLEKATANALELALKKHQIPESVVLRREHITALRALYDSEVRLIKIGEARGQLIRVERALNLINECLQSGILVLRRLPELARDAEQRQALEAFMNGVLSELKSGAAEGVSHAA